MPIRIRSTRSSQAWRSTCTRSGPVSDPQLSEVVGLARGIAEELTDLAPPARPAADAEAEFDWVAEFDRRVVDPDLRAATRTRFVTGHYTDAVEAAVKALNECVRTRSGRSEDGDSLMTKAFSPNAPLLRLNRLWSKSDESEQSGHMLLFQGVVAAWRNPRAHSLVDDHPSRALMMIESIGDLITTTKGATRTRRRKSL